MKYKPLNMFTKQTGELKRLIAEHPDYPIVVLCESEVVMDDDGWWCAPELRCSVGEILDCWQDINDEKTYIDRGDFEADVQDYICSDDDYYEMTEEELDREVEERLKEYEPYWKDVIIIWAGV